MRALRRLMFLVAGVVFALGSVAAGAQTLLRPDAYLQNAGCFSIRCFMYLHGLDGDTAVTINTGPGLAIHTRSPGPTWSVQQKGLRRCTQLRSQHNSTCGMPLAPVLEQH